MARPRRHHTLARPSRRLLTAAVTLLTLTAGACLAVPAGATGRRAAAAPTPPPAPAVPHPFDRLSCAPYAGIRLCRGGQRGALDLRVPSFDGVPLDADVALPATGTGPFPLIVLLHGLGASKAEWEVSRDDGGIDDITLARLGYAVLMYTARGFGDSCGTTASRVDTPGCARGWIQLADQRYEIRDTQYLAGMLVDEGLVKPAIAVAGLSYGAGQSLELAVLKNRMRLPDGSLVPFVSPVRHVPMRVAAAYAMWPWDDLVTALVPNGNLTGAGTTPAAADTDPAGVAKQSWDTLLYADTTLNYLSPPGVDLQSDLTTWFHELMAGEPYGPAETNTLHIIQDDKSAIGIPLGPGGPAPTAIQSGWTDTLFPVTEAQHYAARVRSAGLHTPLLLMYDDVGHGWAQDKGPDIAYTNRQGIAFLNAVMFPRAGVRPPTGVRAIAQTCPASAPSGPAMAGTSLAALAPHVLVLSGTAAQTVTSSGGDPQIAADLNPAYAQQPLCRALPAAAEPGTARYLVPVGSSAKTLLGGVVVRARLHVVGDYPELVARLWDVAPGGATRQIVAMGVLRPSVNQATGATPASSAEETVRFGLNPNEYTLAAGNTVELELVGSNAPYFRASNGTFRITVTGLRATLPLR